MNANKEKKSGQKICDDCILKDTCEYIPEEFELVRCLDKVKEKKQQQPENAEGK